MILIDSWRLRKIAGGRLRLPGLSRFRQVGPPQNAFLPPASVGGKPRQSVGLGDGSLTLAGRAFKIVGLDWKLPA